MTRRSLTAAVLTVALAAVPLLSCFSERDGVTGPIAGDDCRIPASAIGRNRVVVLIRNFAFFPDTLRVRPGTIVTWVNCEPANIDAHTSTGDGNAWDSGTLPPGGSYERTFTGAGANSYFCRPHPFMRGTVLVQ